MQDRLPHHNHLWPQDSSEPLEFIKNITVFLDESGRAFAEVSDEARTMLAIESAGFRKWLSFKYHRCNRKNISKWDVDDIIATLAGRAAHEGAKRSISCRVAATGDRLYLDLGDSSRRVVEITAKGHVIVDPPVDVCFIRPKGLLPLPTPVVDETAIKRFQELLRLSDDQMTIVLAWLVASLRPGDECPILHVFGTNSDALALAIRNLVDPHSSGIRSCGRTEQDLRIAASQGWCHVVQINRIVGWLSDSIRNIYFDTTLGMKQLYTNDEEVLFGGRHPMILVSDFGRHLGDALVPYVVTIEAPELGGPSSKSVQQLRKELDTLRPRILEMLLTMLSATIEWRDYRPACAGPLMEFQNLGAQLEVGHWPNGSFIQAYAASRLAGDPFARRLVQFTLRTKHWFGTATELLYALERFATSQEQDSATWPQNPTVVGKKVRELGSLVAEFGVTIGAWREPGGARERKIVLKATS
ncbi:MAG: hypothetical protein ABI824_15885 [Acidobacteriota bacterium]